MPPANSHSLARRIGGAELHVVEGAGHFWWATMRASWAFARAVLDCYYSLTAYLSFVRWAHYPLEVAKVIARFLEAPPPAEHRGPHF